MATAAENSNPTKKPKKGGKGPGQNSAVRLKTVVRKLPPNLPEDTFWQSVAPWVDDNTCTWKTFHAGKLKGVRFSSTSVFSRAYISFKTPEQLATFSQAYDSHVFKDKQGNEYQAVVEFAPYQKVPIAPKNDTRQGTIEDDEDFKSFVTSLSAPDAPTETVAEPSSPPKSTPLLEALIQSKEKTSGGNKRSGPGGVLTILSRTQQLKADEQHFSRASPIVPTGEQANSGAGGTEKEGVNIKGRGKRTAPPVQPGAPSTSNSQKQRRVSGGKPAASPAKQSTPAAAPSGDQQRAVTPTKNRSPAPATSPDEARKRKRIKEKAKKEREKGKEKEKEGDQGEDGQPATGSSGQQQAHTRGSVEKPARKTAPGQPLPAASSSSQAHRGRTASVGGASESGPAQAPEGEPKSPTTERGRGRGRGRGEGGGGGSGGGGRGGRGRGRGGAKEVDRMDVPVKIIQRPTAGVAPPSAPAEPASAPRPASASASASASAPLPTGSVAVEGGDGGSVADGSGGGGGGGGGGGESRGGRGGQRSWRGRGRGGNHRGRGRGRGE